MIHVAPYDPNWPTIYAREAALLRETLGDIIVAIEHIGSTAVPNLAAKRTIDILIGVKDLKRIDKTVIKKLHKLSYEYVKAVEKEIPNRRYFQKLNAEGQHRFHVHIVVINSAFWKRHLLFRDYLITHPKAASAYGEHKKKLAVKFKQDRESYTQAKAQLVKMIDEKAQQWDHNNRVIIKTARLKLRPLRLTDLDDFVPICADHKVMRFIAGGVQTREKVAENLKTWVDNYQRYGFGLLAVIMKKNNQFIGFCGLTTQRHNDHKYIELGYRLAQDVWGQGLATEAAMAVRDYAFNELCFNELYSFIHIDNIASKRVSQKLGFRLFKKISHWGLPVNLYKITNTNSK